jgi:hypothetical protein
MADFGSIELDTHQARATILIGASFFLDARDKRVARAPTAAGVLA